MNNAENPVKIQSLEIENVKRVQAVSFELAPDGLTLIGGKNAQGKTTVLDAIAFALGGNKKKPSNIKRDGSVVDPQIKVTLSNGLVVERKGKNSSLTVTDPSGKTHGQTLLNSFLSELALDLPKFINSSDKDKAKTLLEIIGVQDELAELDDKEARLAEDRKLCGREVKTKKGHYEDLPYYQDQPEELISASELISQSQSILEKNAKNQNLRNNLAGIEAEGKRVRDLIDFKKGELDALEKTLEEIKEKYKIAKSSAENLEDESTQAIQEKIADIDAINAKIQSNMDKQEAKDEYQGKKAEYDDLTEKIDEVRSERTALLNGADLPLPELSIVDGKLTYKGQFWDCMSGSEQLIVATAIVRKLKPECGFVLTDKLEQMDADTLKNFHSWLVQEGLQNIGTIVGDREECQIIIENGLVAKNRSVKLSTSKQEEENWDFN